LFLLFNSSAMDGITTSHTYRVY